MSMILDKLLKGQKVEWLSLKEIAKVSIGEFVHQTKQNPLAEYPVYNGGTSPTGYYEKYNNLGNRVIISARGANAGFVNRVYQPYWSGNSCYSIKANDPKKTNWLYVFHYLKHNQNKLLSNQQKGGIPAVSKKQVEDFLIPYPSIDVQAKIVKILDAFTALTAELTAELTMREKQYHYYRDNLLTFSDDEVEWKTLGNIALKISSGGTPKTGVAEYYDGNIPWLRTQEVNFGEIWETDIKITELGLKNSVVAQKVC